MLLLGAADGEETVPRGGPATFGGDAVGDGATDASGAPGRIASCGGSGALTGAVTPTGTGAGSALRLPSTATGANARATGAGAGVPVADTAERAPNTAPPSTPTTTRAITARPRYPRALTSGSTGQTRLSYDLIPPDRLPCTHLHRTVRAARGRANISTLCLTELETTSVR